MKKIIRATMNYGEWLVLPDEFPDSAIMMLLGARYYVKEEYVNSEEGYRYIIENQSHHKMSKFDFKVLPDFDVPLPDMSDPKDLAIEEMRSRIKELEAQLKRRVKG